MGIKIKKANAKTEKIPKNILEFLIVPLSLHCPVESIFSERKMGLGKK